LVSLAIGLFLTFSRSCWLAVAAVYTPVTLFLNRKLFIALLALGIIGLIAVPYARERVRQSLDINQWSSGRAGLWQVAGEHINDRPIFGHGLGSFDSIVTPDIRETLSDKGVGDWHNQYLQIYMESGFIGLVLFLWMLYEFIRLFQMFVWRQADASVRQAGIGGLCLVSGAMLIGLFEDYLCSPSANITFWSLLGYGAGSIRFPKPGGAQ
jgi:O-antigen ligase